MILVSKGKEMSDAETKTDTIIHPSRFKHTHFGPADMTWTAVLRAEICDGAVQHVNLVKEIHRCRYNQTETFNFNIIILCMIDL